MKTFPIFIATIFISFGAAAQTPYPAVAQNEKPRNQVKPCASQAEATAGASRYVMPLDGRIPATVAAEAFDNAERTASFDIEFTPRFDWLNRGMILRVENAAFEYSVSLNGRQIGDRRSGTTPAEFNLAGASEGANTLTFTLYAVSSLAPIEDFRTRAETAWRSSGRAVLSGVSIVSQPPIRIRDLTVRTYTDNNRTRSDFAVAVATSTLNEKRASIRYSVSVADTLPLLEGKRDITLSMRGEDSVKFFATPTPEMLWSAENPCLCRVDLTTIYENRPAEVISFVTGMRSVKVAGGKMLVNGRPVTLKAARTDDGSRKRIDELHAKGYNALLLRSDICSEQTLAHCDSVGMYVIVEVPIDASHSPKVRIPGGTPSNNPAWCDAYIALSEQAFYTTRLHPCVTAYSLAHNSSNGINLYESYLHLKSLTDCHAVIYPAAAGEWNSDAIDITIDDVSVRR